MKRISSLNLRQTRHTSGVLSVSRSQPLKLSKPQVARFSSRIVNTRNQPSRFGICPAKGSHSLHHQTQHTTRHFSTLLTPQRLTRRAPLLSQTSVHHFSRQRSQSFVSLNQTPLLSENLSQIKRSISWYAQKPSLLKAIYDKPGMISLRKKNNQKNEKDDKPRGGSSGEDQWDPETTVEWTSATEALNSKYEALQVFRASDRMFDKTMVNSTKGIKSISQLGDVSVKGASEVHIHLFDPKNTKAVLQTIQSLQNDLVAKSEEEKIVVTVPPVTSEFRESLKKIAGREFEEAKVSVRNLRRKALDNAKALKLPKDSQRVAEQEVQKCHDETIKKLEKLHNEKLKQLEH